MHLFVHNSRALYFAVTPERNGAIVYCSPRARVMYQLAQTHTHIFLFLFRLLSLEIELSLP